MIMIARSLNDRASVTREICHIPITSKRHIGKVISKEGFLLGCIYYRY